MAYKLNGEGLAFDVPFTHNEINYPANWLRLSTEEERKAAVAKVHYAVKGQSYRDEDV